MGVHGKRELFLHELSNLQSLCTFLKQSNLQISAVSCDKILPPRFLDPSALKKIEIYGSQQIVMPVVGIQSILEECNNLSSLKLDCVTLDGAELVLGRQLLNLREFHISQERIANVILEHSPNLEVFVSRRYAALFWNADFSSHHLKVVDLGGLYPECIDKIMHLLACGSSNTLQHAVLFDACEWDAFTNLEPIHPDFQFRALKCLECSVTVIKWLVECCAIDPSVLPALKLHVQIGYRQPLNHYPYVNQLKPEIDKLTVEYLSGNIPDTKVDTLTINNVGRAPRINVTCRRIQAQSLSSLQYILQQPNVVCTEELTLHLSSYRLPKRIILERKAELTKVNLILQKNSLGILHWLMGLIEMTGAVSIVVHKHETCKYESEVQLWHKARSLEMEWAMNDWEALILVLLWFPQIQSFHITFTADQHPIPAKEFAKMMYSCLRSKLQVDTQKLTTMFETHVMCETTGERRIDSGEAQIEYYGYLKSFGYLLKMMEELEYLEHNS